MIKTHSIGAPFYNALGVSTLSKSLDGCPTKIYDKSGKTGGNDAGKEYGEVQIIDVKTDKHDIKVDAHPAELLLDESGKTLYVFVSSVSKVQVVDIKKREVLYTWPVSSQRNGDGAFVTGICLQARRIKRLLSEEI